MGLGYQKRDLEIIDYQLYSIIDPKSDRYHILRGPKPNFVENNRIVNNNYFTDIGAAYTFGCYVDKTYGQIIQERIGIPTLNFGISGAGPSFFLHNRGMLELINNGKFAIVNVLSGRSESNSMFESGGKEMYKRKSDGQRIAASNAFQELIKSDIDLTKRIIKETRENWIINFNRLLNEIKVPKILFWFSRRQSRYKESFENVNSLFGKFPQLVNSSMIREIADCSDFYCECITSNGLPHKLINRFTSKETYVMTREDLGGKKRYFNNYYASQEMHIDAANKLLPIVKRIRS